MIDFTEYFFFNLLKVIAQRLSFRSAGRLGKALGWIVFSLTGFRKAITIDNLTKAFPEYSSDQIVEIARGAYRNYGIGLIEFLWASNKSEPEFRQIVRAANPEVLHNALARGKGVLFLSAHYGAWEFLITGIRFNFNAPVTSIIQHQRNRRVDEMIDADRSRFGNSTIPMGVASRRVLAALAEGKIVLLLGDQSGPKEAVFVDFFGRPAATHRGAAAFSLKTGAPIVMGLVVRQPDGTYVLALEEVDRAGLTSSSEESILELTRRHVAMLERWVRLHPDHWLWMHKRWKHTQFYELEHAEEETA